MTTKNINKDLIESGRVYLSLVERNTLLIKCMLCTTADLIDWVTFRRHLSDHHAFGKFCVNQQQMNLDEEILAEVELEQQNLCNYRKNEFVDHFDLKTDSEDEAAKEIYDYAQIDNDVKEAKKHFVINKPNQPFYSLLNTSSELMLSFIKLLRKHEYLWKTEYRNMDFKQERLESAKQISKKLFNRFQVRIIPQVICYSACTLLKWFRKQFAMCENNPRFRSRHQEYFEKLSDFVPTDNIQTVDCDECDRRFYDEDQLRRHKYHAHGGCHPYVCEVCNMRFLHACKLRMHKIRFHERSTRWKCQLCNYCAPNKWDLHVHLPSHSGERNYTCEQCGVTAKNMSALAVHRRTHSNVKMYCPYCFTGFREKYVLTCHIKNKHPEVLEQESD